MNLSFINHKGIINQFKRKDISDEEKGRYAIYLIEFAYKEGFDDHKALLNAALNSQPDLEKYIPAPSFRLKIKKQLNKKR